MGFRAVLALGAAGLVLAAPVSAERIERDGFAYEHAPQAAWVEVAEVPDRWPDDAPGANDASWRNWLLDAQVDRRGERVDRYFDHVVEATTAELVPTAAKFSMEFDPAYQTLVIHDVSVRRGGTWSDRFDSARITLARRESDFESDMADGRVSALVVVDDVRPGDLVRYRYAVRGENPIVAGMAHDGFLLGWVDPILERRVRVLLPVGTDAAVRVAGSAPQPTVRRTADGVEVLHVGRALAAIQPDSGAPSWYDLHPRLEVAPRRAWADVVQWGLKLYPPDRALPPELEARVARWAAIDDVDQRIAAALQAVQDEVRYFSVLLGDSTHRPAEPASTWTRRYGDCKDKAWLLATVLQRIGVPAVPALVSVGRERGIGPALPAASQFDHVIVRATPAGRVLWLDPTLTLQRGPIADRLAWDYGFALPIAAGTRALERIDPAPRGGARTRVEERFEPIEDGAALRYTVDTRYAGDAATRRRRDLAARGAEAVSRDFTEYYRRRHGELEVDRPMRVEDDERTGELLLRESYVLRKPWAASTPSQRGFDLFADALDEVLSLQGAIDRRSPLSRAHPHRVEQITRFVVPEGWRVDGTPAKVEVDDPAFGFRRTSIDGEGVIELRQAYESRADHVPLDALARHFDARREAVDALSLRLVLDLPAVDARSERDRRLRGLLRDIIREKEQGDGKD